MVIRKYCTDDHEDVISLWKICGLVKPWNDPDRDIQRKLGVDPDLFLIGLEDGHLAASVMGGYEGHRGWINYLAVHPEYRRRGYGREIMCAVEMKLREKGAPKINLQIRTSNSDAAGFYEAIGFKQDDVISMGKRLVDEQEEISILHTNGANADFIELCRLLDQNLDELVGGAFQREQYVQYNQLDDINDAFIVYCDGTPAACGSFKHYDTDTGEVKRVFVQKDFRGRGLAVRLLREIELCAGEKGYSRLILETGRPLKAAMELYRKSGFKLIANYGQYRDMEESVCMAKPISQGNTV